MRNRDSERKNKEMEQVESVCLSHAPLSQGTSVGRIYQVCSRDCLPQGPLDATKGLFLMILSQQIQGWVVRT